MSGCALGLFVTMYKSHSEVTYKTAKISFRYFKSRGYNTQFLLLLLLLLLYGLICVIGFPGEAILSLFCLRSLCCNGGIMFLPCLSRILSRI